MKKVRGSRTAINLQDQKSVTPVRRTQTPRRISRSNLLDPNKVYTGNPKKINLSNLNRNKEYMTDIPPSRTIPLKGDQSPSFNTTPSRKLAPDSLGVKYRAPNLESSRVINNNPSVKRIQNSVMTTSPISKPMYKPTGGNITPRMIGLGENRPPTPSRVGAPRVYGNNSFGIVKRPSTLGLGARGYSKPLDPLKVSNVSSSRRGLAPSININSTPVLNYGTPSRYGTGMSNRSITPSRKEYSVTNKPIRVGSHQRFNTPTSKANYLKRSATNYGGVSPLKSYYPSNNQSYQAISPYRKVAQPSTSLNQLGVKQSVRRPIYQNPGTPVRAEATAVVRERTPVTYGTVTPQVVQNVVYTPPVTQRVVAAPVTTVRRVYSPYRVTVAPTPIPPMPPRTPLRAKRFIPESRKPPPGPRYMARVDKSPDRQRSIVRDNGPVPPHEADPYVPPSSYKTPEQVNVVQAEKIAKREVTKIKEVVDTDLSNKDQFFRNYNTAGQGLDVGDVDANKLSMNDLGTTIYASGLNGTSVVGVNGPNLSKLGTTDTQRPSTTVECVRDNHVVLQQPNSNDLYLVDEDLNTVKVIDGLNESGPVNEDFHHYRHSLDYAYLLWKSGQDNLSIVDTETFECVEVIKQFWTYNNKSSMPVAAAANSNADKVVATSQAGPENYIIHYYEDSIDTNVAYAKPVGQVIPSMYELTAIEVASDESRVYIGGKAIVDGRAGAPVVIACAFDEYLNETAAHLLDDLDYNVPRRIVRKEGTEILFVGCDRHIAILEYVGGRLVQLSSLPNVHDNPITDMVTRGRFLYSTAYGEPFIKSTEFNMGGGAGGPMSSGIVNGPPGGVRVNPNSRYGSFQTDKFSYAGLDDLHKVESSDDGARVFAGGKGLHRFDTAGSQLNPIEIDVNKGKFYHSNQIDINYFGLKATPNNMLMIQEPNTNNLVVLTEDLDFERSVDGKQKCIFRKSHQP